MTIMPEELSTAELLADTRQRFDSRADIGPMTGALERLTRYLTGDPISHALVSSASFNVATTLPVEPRARVAVCQVAGNPIAYRTDAVLPNAANDSILSVGTIFYLYGQPTITGFIFHATSIATATVSVDFYD